MMPRLGEKYDVEIQTTSKPIAEYQTDEYFELDLPLAPAVMVGDEIVVEGSGIDEYEVEKAICRHLGIEPPEQIDDYLEALAPHSLPDHPGAVTGNIKIILDFASFMTGPGGGEEVLSSILRQVFFHQPGFNLVEVEQLRDDSPSLAEIIHAPEIDGVIRINLDHWQDSELRAEIEYLLPGEKTVNLYFYDRGRMKLWRFIELLVRQTRNNWRWTGRVFAVVELGAYLNLGEVHGIAAGDTFAIGDHQLTVGQLGEDFLRLDFPTPLYRSRITRGSRAYLLERAGDD